MRNYHEIDAEVVRINVWHRDVSLWALIDLADLPLLERNVQWYASPAKAPVGKYYCFAKYWKPEEKRSITVGLHQVIMGTVGLGPSVEVHHKDNDGLNCRRGNLVQVDHKTNHRERDPEKDWGAHDRRHEARAAHRREIAAMNAVIEKFGYTRQYVWMVRTGKRHNPTVLSLLSPPMV